MERKLGLLSLVFAAIAISGASVQSAAQNLITNGSFEDPRITPGVADNWVADAGLLPGWSTTAGDNTVELWTDGFLDPDPPWYQLLAYAGDQLLVLNGDEGRDLFQDVVGVSAGSILGFQFASRGFRGGGHHVRFTITDLGVDGVLGGGDDTVLFTEVYLQSTYQWRLHSDATEPLIFAIGNPNRISFQSLSGPHLLDSVTFGTGLPVELQSFTIVSRTHKDPGRTPGDIPLSTSR
jgi:hypothetical protein